MLCEDAFQFAKRHSGLDADGEIARVVGQQAVERRGGKTDLRGLRSASQTVLRKIAAEADGLLGRCGGAQGIGELLRRIRADCLHCGTSIMTEFGSLIGAREYVRLRAFTCHARHSRESPVNERLRDRPDAGPPGARDPGAHRGSGQAGVHRHPPPRRAAGAAAGAENRGAGAAHDSGRAFWTSTCIATISPRCATSPC